MALDAEVWAEVEAADATVPDFIEEQDGWYTHRLVLDGPTPVGFLPEGTSLPTDALQFHEEPLSQPIPRMRQRLVWRSPLGGDENGSERNERG